MKPVQNAHIMFDLNQQNNVNAKLSKFRDYIIMCYNV